MIQGIYETHLFVRNLQKSIDFYQNTLGFELCYTNENRRLAFFWVGKPKEFMLGLWEKPPGETQQQHFAFRADLGFILNDSVNFLEERDLKPYNFLNDGTERPMVFGWMPALSIYFRDPDNHELEFIAILAGKSRPDLGVIAYDKWLRTSEMMDVKEQIITNYINAYNNFDVASMIKDFTENIKFENVSGGVVNMTLNGLTEFSQQAEQAKNLFSNRKQTILSFNHLENQTEIEIDYQGVLAIDLPNGLQKGAELNLKGKSIFIFEDNKITSLTDIS